MRQGLAEETGCDYAPIILRIQPGLTGWWQVMGRHKTTFEQRLRLDE
ncbi:MAG: sugar transferase [Anaerolineales bacterium]|nr:sugar transferase [Anaerolineales bacterium]